MRSKTKTTATKEEAAPARVPKLRFPEFRGAASWEPKTLAEICLLITNGKANAQDHEEDGEYPLFDRSAVIKKSSEFMFDTEAVILPGEGMRFFPKYFRGKFNLHQRAYALMRHQGDGRFVYHSLDYFQDALAEKAVKSTVLSLRLPIVENFVIGCPKPAEQQKIAECLSSVDELMAAQARKLDALKTHKKGLMQQLFPREGETQPRLRFPEFQNAGEWEPETLENLCSAKISYGIVQAGPHVPNGMPYIKSTDLNSELCLDNLARTSEAIAQKYRRSEVVPGDIVFSLRGNIGVAQLLPEGIPVANLTQGTARIRTKGQPEFYFHALRSPSVNSRIQAVGKGSTFQEISLEALRNIRLFRPEPAEQQRIASCLSSLDALITLETQKLGALKTHKKGLMQQLFPSPEGVEA